MASGVGCSICGRDMDVIRGCYEPGCAFNHLEQRNGLEGENSRLRDERDAIKEALEESVGSILSDYAAKKILERAKIIALAAQGKKNEKLKEGTGDGK